ncbi:hypothetical protein Tco_0829291 [Tanacetum coccineum]
MAEAFDEQQQQKLQDAALVPVNEQVKISISNLRIALEKIQLDVIFKVCLEVLKQQSFYNAFIATVDVPEIYMQQFWYTITQELSTQKFYFTMGDQVIEVNEDLLCNAFNITPKDLVHPFTPPAPEKEIIKFVNQIGWKNSCHDRPRLIMLQLLWGMVTSSNIDFAKLIWDEFKRQIETISKALKDPAYGMPIPDVMFNKVIKASTDYSEYLAKSTGSTRAQATCQGKGLLTKDGVEFTVKTVSIHKRKRSQTVTEEIGQSEEAISDEVDSKKTNEEEVEPLVRCRFTGVSIGSEAYQRTTNEEERVDHSKKLKGLETLSTAAQLKLDMKKAQKASKDDFFIQQHSKGSDEPSDASSSSSSNSEITVEDISSDDDEVTEKPDEVTENTNEVTEKDDEVTVKPGAVTKNVDYVTMADEVQPADQQTRDEVHGANIEPVIEAQADVQMFEAQPKKPEATIVSSSHTLSSTEFTNQFLNEHADVNLSEFPKDTVESEVQSIVDIPVKQATPASLRHPLVDSTVTLIPDTTTEPPSQPPPTQPKRIKIKQMMKKPHNLDF